MKTYPRAVTLCFVILSCGACSISTPGPISTILPVAVVSTAFPGGVLRGTLTATSGLSSFKVSDGTLSCGGDYDAHNVSPTISIPIRCSDGRKGVMIVVRENGGRSGGGYFTLNDGSLGDFIFGAQASKL